MNYKTLSPTENIYGLNLADGVSWGISAKNKSGTVPLSLLKEAMKLKTCNNSTNKLSISVEKNVSQWPPLLNKSDHSVRCTFSSALNSDMLVIQLLWLSLIISLESEKLGGLLLHGALSERDGKGIILAGPGGVGKTTASLRLPKPWRSLCDDQTLVVRDNDGKYWAHPWPSWSKFMFNGTGGAYDVQHAVPLNGILFLSQSPIDKIHKVSIKHTISMLVESAKQASEYMSHGLGKKVLSEIRLNRFNNICALAQNVPSYILQLSLYGAFWLELERVM